MRDSTKGDMPERTEILMERAYSEREIFDIMCRILLFVYFNGSTFTAFSVN